MNKTDIVVCCQLLPCFCTEGRFGAMVAKPEQVNALITEILCTSFKKEWLKIQQVLMKSYSLILLTADTGIRNGRSYVTSTEKTWPDTLYEIMVCLAKLGLIMAYTFLCDR